MGDAEGDASLAEAAANVGGEERAGLQAEDEGRAAKRPRLAAAEGEEAGGPLAAAEGGEGAGGPLPRVRRVSAAEAAARAVPLHRILLPLPGWAVAYPGHSTAQVYSRLAAADGVRLDAAGGVNDSEARAAAAAAPPPEFSLVAPAGLPGAYRRVVRRLPGLTYRLVRYADPCAALARTDLDRFAGGGSEATDRLGEPAASPESDAEARPVGEGPLLALQLRFRLPPASYATMAIRELLKESTSTNHHRALNNNSGRGFGGSAAAHPGKPADRAEAEAAPPA